MSATVTRLDDYRASKKPAPLRPNWSGIGGLGLMALSALIAFSLVWTFVIAPLLAVIR